MKQQEYTPYGKNGKGNGKATVNDGLSIANALLKLKEEFDSVGTKFNGLTWQRIEKAMQSYSNQQNAELREKVKDLEHAIEFIGMEKAILRDKIEVLQERLGDTQDHYPLAARIHNAIAKELEIRKTTGGSFVSNKEIDDLINKALKK